MIHLEALKDDDVEKEELHESFVDEFRRAQLPIVDVERIVDVICPWNSNVAIIVNRVIWYAIRIAFKMSFGEDSKMVFIKICECWNASAIEPEITKILGLLGSQKSMSELSRA